MKELKISKTLSLPIDVITQALAFIGRRGSGKSYAATKLAELLASIGAQFIAIDPVGIWYSLRLAKDGKSKGLDIVIFGGLNGDLPIEATGGALIADIIADRNISAVIDVSQFESDADKARFARDFASRFFFRKKAQPSAVHIFIEEAQEFIPQNIQKGEERMLHDWQRMIRLGRNYGIGVSMISQRPQDINKKALNQAECVFAFQLTGTHEREAVKAWISDKGLKEDLFHTLTTLETGHAHVWSPAWLRISEEIVIAPKDTFAAGSTPKLGDKPISVKSLAPIELEKLKEDMKATIEKMKADDPRELKKLVASQKAEIAKLLSAKPVKATAGISLAIPKPSNDKAYKAAIDKREKEISVALKTIYKVKDKAMDLIADLTTEINKVSTALQPLGIVPTIDLKTASELTVQPNASVKIDKPYVSAPKPVRTSSTQNGDLTNPQQRILNALAWLESIGIEQGSRTIVAFLADASSKSSSYLNNIYALRSNGYLDYPQPNFLALTDNGKAVAETPDTPLTSEELHASIYPKLTNPQAAILRCLIKHYPNAISRDDTAAEIGVSSNSSSYLNNIYSLRSFGFIDYPQQGFLKAQPLLFID